MAQKGLCSRREADCLIENGQVFVDGKKIDVLGTKVDPNAEVTLTDLALKQQGEKATILLNKPVGIVSNLPENGYKEALDLITSDHQDKRDSKQLRHKHLRGLSVVGRLDIDSKGLLILTQDGRLAKSVIGEDSSVEKEYFVRTKEIVTDKHITQLLAITSLDGRPLKKIKAELKSEHTISVILNEGKKRQIRHMCEKVNLTVIELKRVRIGKIHLGGLKPGTWRFLRPSEKIS